MRSNRDVMESTTAEELVELCDAAEQKRAECTCGREYPSSHDADCREAVTALAIYNARTSLYKLGFKDEPNGDARARQYAALLEALEACEQALGVALGNIGGAGKVRNQARKYVREVAEQARAVLATEVKS